MRREELLAKFLSCLTSGRYAEAERTLGVLRKRLAKRGAWGEGYLMALEGLLNARRASDEVAFALTLEEDLGELKALRREFGSKARSLHGDYDRGFFSALRELVSVALGLKRQGAM